METICVTASYSSFCKQYKMLELFGFYMSRLGFLQQIHAKIKIYVLSCTLLTVHPCLLWGRFTKEPAPGLPINSMGMDCIDYFYS